MSSLTTPRLLATSTTPFHSAPISYRRPILRTSARAFSSSPISQANYFKINLHRWRLSKDRSGVWVRRAIARDPARDKSPSPAMSSQVAEVMAARKVQNDFGLLPGTIVVGSFLFGSGARGQPSLLSGPLALLRAEFGLYKRRAQDLLSRIWIWRLNGKPSVPIDRKQLKKQAQAKYVAQYRHFAEGNVVELESLCCDGLAGRYAAAIRARQSSQPLHWKLVRWKASPKIVSDRAAPIPEAEKVHGREPTLRQAVVRLTSSQLFTSKSGDEVQKHVTEYVVMQQRVFRGLVEPWKVQGFVEPPRWDELEGIFQPDSGQSTVVRT